MSEWQPIETAPKDGTEVDLWVVERNRGRKFRIPDCHWHCDEWLVWGGDPEIGWDLVEEYQHATHWMLSPEPPE